MNKSLLDKLEERDGLLEKLKSELAGREESLAVAKEQTKNEDKQQVTYTSLLFYPFINN